MSGIHHRRMNNLLDEVQCREDRRFRILMLVGIEVMLGMLVAAVWISVVPVRCQLPCDERGDTVVGMRGHRAGDARSTQPTQPRVGAFAVAMRENAEAPVSRRG